MNRTTETLGNATGQTGWRKTYARNWTPPAQPCGAWGRKMKPDVQTQALQAFGADRQVDKCIEELGELATALVKYRHGEASAADVIDELADVYITTGTIAMLFDRDAVKERVAVKLSRLSRLVADQVAAKPEPKPEKPMLRWEAGKGDELILYRWSRQIGSVTRSPYYADQWVAYADGKPTTTHAHKETAINIVCMELGLRVDEVPLWKP